MSCILCLEANGATGATHIHIYSDEGKRLDVERIIENHFWLQFDTAAPGSRTICQECWQLLLTFHQFYLRIQHAHKKLSQELSDVLLAETSTSPSHEPDSCSNQLSVDLKPEFSNIKIEADSEVCGARKRRRGRSRNSENVKKPLPRRSARNTSENVYQKELGIEEKVEAATEHLDEEEEEEFKIPLTTIKTEQTDSLNVFAENADDALSQGSDDADGEEEDYSNKTTSASPRVPKGPNGKVSQQFDEFIASNFKLICFLCDASEPNFGTLMKHFRAQHKMRGYVLCCGKKLLKRGVLVDHIRSHQDPLYFKCPRCEKVLANRRCLELHLKGHDRSRERIFRCAVCSKGYYRRAVYARHMLLHVPEEQKKIDCPQCDKTFATTYIMNQHLRLTHLNKYAKICDICGKSIRGKDALKRHMEEHAGVPPAPIQCELCGLHLTTKYGLVRHMKVMHTAENRQEQVCAICSKVSPSVTAHRRHMQYMHSMERKYACPMCEKAFKRATDLREHMTTHTGEVLYTCEHCPKTFNSNANMHSHRKKVHRKEWEEKRRKKYQMSQKTNPQQLMSSSMDIIVTGN